MQIDTSLRTYRKVALAACFGTFLEWYDFLAYASLATYFATLFFPPDEAVRGLLASLAAFGVGMVVRPLGAALFGSLGDRYGRRTVFIATIALMGGATFAIGLLPTYRDVGFWAAAMLLALRLIQGLAMGGEIGGANVYLTEHAPADRRGAYTSVLQLMGGLGIMASSFQVVLLQSWLSAEEFRAWGWRVPFLVSALLLLVSVPARLALQESPLFEALRQARKVAAAPLRECFADRHTLGRMALLFFCISAGGSLLFFSSQVYAGVFLKTVVKMDPVTAGRLTLGATLALFPLTIACGWLSDLAGRRPVVLAGLALGALTIVPVFHGLRVWADQPLLIFLLLMVPVLAVALVTGPQTAMLGELFPTRTRYTAVGLPHNLAAGWIGGLSPFMMAWIGKVAGDSTTGLWYPATLLLGTTVVGALFLPETRGRSLSD
jgi:MFS family permease